MLVPKRPVLWLTAISLVAFWGWAATFSIEQQVRGLGEIIPSGQNKVIQHLEGGIVQKIEVIEGAEVQAGDPLFQVSNALATAAAGELEAQAAAARLRIARLESELVNAPTPDFSTLAATAPENLIVSEAQLFRARMSGFTESLNILEQQLRQKQLKLEEMKTQAKNLRAEMDVAQKQFDINKKLLAAGAVSESKFLDSKSAVQNFITRIGQVEKSIPVSAAEANEAERRIGELKEKRRGEILDDLNKSKLALKQLQERSTAPADQLKRTTVTSPIRGIVKKIHINTVDGVVKPGDKLAEITPLDDTLIVEARITTRDRGLVWSGLPAIVKISAYDYSIYGGLDGRVTEISPDTLMDEKGAPYYRVRVSLDKETAGNMRKFPGPLVPGMTAEVNILSSKITIWQYLMRPVWRISENALREAQ
jgi:HlyD family type I secretion membrane fusion protein